MFSWFVVKLLYYYTPEKKLGGGFIWVAQWSVCPAIRCIVFVQSITWRLMVGIQYNFIQWSSTLGGSAVHKNHNSILTNYRVIALCYFSLSEA
jgi:hypothetical protein